MTFEIRRGNKNQGKVLMIAYFAKSSVPSVAGNIAFYQSNSRYRVHLLNLFDHRADTGFLKLPAYIDLNDYAVVVIHNTVAYDSRNLESLDALIKTKLADYKGVKIILRQDEHFQFNKFVAYASRVGFDCVFSVMPESEWGKTYKKYLPESRIVPMLTGYVTPEQRKAPNFEASRNIDIGYRGSIMPLSFGRLCYDKRKIGDVVGSRLDSRGLKLDISSEWSDRKGGKDWYDFLADCRAVLGVESGTDVFDLDGSVADACKEIERLLGVNDGSDSYAERYLSKLEGMLGPQIKYYAISPRHFEAIAAGAVQIMFPGYYSGRLVGGRHYFELARDYSNLDDVVSFLNDKKAIREIAVRAFEEVILDKRNWIESFVSDLDREVDNALVSKTKTQVDNARLEVSAPGKGRNVLILQAHEFGLDPRRDHWYAQGAPDGLLFHNVGVSKNGKIAYSFSDHGGLILDVPRRAWIKGCMNKLAREVADDAVASTIIRELIFLDYCRTLDGYSLFELFGFPATADNVAKFKWYIGYLLDTAVTLVQAAVSIRNVNAILAINLPGLIPSIIAARILDVPVIFEALEYWAEADPQQTEFMEQFWVELEKRIVAYADVRGTVSPPLARVMEDSFGFRFNALPNAAPLKSKVQRTHQTVRSTEKLRRVRFLFQGNFAEHRGLEDLIDAWGSVNPRAHLYLRGPANAFAAALKKRASDLGLDKQRVHFLPAVDVEDLVQAAWRDADVALIPYPPIGRNYECCSPNKMGQYLAAGLPILANRTKFVEQTITEANAGIVVDFTSKAKLAEAVDRMCDDADRERFSQNASNFFDNEFHWEKLSKGFYAEINGLLNDAKQSHEIIVSLADIVSQPSQGRASSDRDFSRTRISIFRRAWQALPLSLREKLKPIILRLM